MRKFLPYLIISIITLSLSFIEKAHCKTLSAEEIIDSLTTQLNGINTIKADINQTISGNGLSETYKGNYIATHPGKIRVEYNSPYEQLIVSNGDTLWWYIPDSKKIWYLEINQNKESAPQLCPADPSNFKFSNTEDFSLRLRKRKWFNLGNRPYIIDLFPKSTTNSFSKITLWIDNKKLFLQKYKIYGPNGKEVLSEERNRPILLSDKFWLPQEIVMRTKPQGGVQKLITRYSNMEVNINVSENTFNFTIPEGIDKIPLSSVK
jgi:outer membrane lipoprotein-sorting protein